VDASLARVGRLKNEKEKKSAVKLESAQEKANQAVLDLDQLEATVKADLQIYISKEHDCADRLYEMIDIEHQYLKLCTTTLEERLSTIQTKVQSNPQRFIYKLLLKDHLSATKRKIALPI
jgi:hypothetical protein